jgi:hypothetical protein
MGHEAERRTERPQIVGHAGGVVTTLALCALVLGACAMGRGTAGGSGASDPSRVLHEFVECLRTHGLPDFPTGTVDANGAVHWPPSAPDVPDSAISACGAIWRRLPPQPASSPPVPNAVFQRLLGFARCMRSNGFPQWPDPTSDGVFHVDLAGFVKSQLAPVLGECERSNPGAAGAYSFGPAAH